MPPLTDSTAASTADSVADSVADSGADSSAASGRPAAAPPASPPLASLPLSPPIVHTRGDRRSLQFKPGQIQSEMRMSRPDQLVLSYVRAMMCFTLFQPRPEHIVMVGLGGGSLLKFCHRYLPHSRITVLELRADVIALRAQFAIPPDDARLTILHADAVQYLAGLTAAADVLLVDGFDADGMPSPLGSARFYADCRRALRPGGVLVANLFSYDPHYRAMLHRLRLAFANRLCWFHGIAGNNRILFAVNGDAPSPALAMLQRVARWQGLWLGPLNRLLARWVVRRVQRDGLLQRRRQCQPA